MVRCNPELRCAPLWALLFRPFRTENRSGLLGFAEILCKIGWQHFCPAPDLKYQEHQEQAFHQP
jgi:hypothetical protein